MDKLSQQLCKLGAPFALFISAPIYATGLGLSFYQAAVAGEKLTGKEILIGGGPLVAIIWFGLWMGRKGYGWFERS